MNIKESLSYLMKKLKEANIATYGIDAMIILKLSINKDELFCLTNPEYRLNEKEIETLKELLAKRKKKYPMAYIQHIKEFYGFELYVDENVLIPRPETELLVDTTLELAKRFINPKILDVGTGSGAIAISLSKILNTTVFASDISFNALLIAKKNARKLNADIQLINADTLSFLNTKIDIIVSNPPYIDEKEYNNLQDDVKFEPKKALIAKNGTEIIEKLIKEAEHLCKYLTLEIGYNQEDFVKSFDCFYDLKKDFSNLPRVAVFKF